MWLHFSFIIIFCEAPSHCALAVVNQNVENIQKTIKEPVYYILLLPIAPKTVQLNCSHCCLLTVSLQDAMKQEIPLQID